MKNFHFQRKLFLYYSTVILFIAAITVAIFYVYSYNSLTRQSRTALSDLSQKTLLSLDSLFIDMDKLALYVSTNPEVRQSFTNTYYQNISSVDLESDIIDILSSITVPNSASKFRITLYNSKGNFISTGVAYDSSVARAFLSSEDYEDWYYSLPIIHTHRSFSLIYKDHLTYSQNPVFSLYREITNPNMIDTAVGIIDIQCPYQYMEEILTLTNGNYSCYLFDSHQQLLFSNGPAEIDPAALYTFSLENRPDDPGDPVTGIYQNWLYTSSSSDFTGFTLVVLQPNSDIMSLIISFMSVLGILAVLLTALGLYFIFFITKKMTQPLKELSEAVNRVSLSNLSLSVPTDGSIDELTQLNHAFHTMFQRLSDSMEENVKMKTHELHAHMIALQSQMDPHFLYNILAIIKSMNRQNCTAHVSAACDYLSSMLRYNTSYEENYVLLEQELNHTKDYLNLMKLRYEDLFEFNLEMDTSIPASCIRIPKLSLQPIVENCFQHGFKNTLPVWHIHIHCWILNRNWYLSVTDNGSGFSEEAIQSIYRKAEDLVKNPHDNLSSLKPGGMGLINTIARLKLKYKDNVTFSIESLPVGGTCITIGGIYYDENFIS